MSRSHVSIWRWVQRLGPILGSIGADPRDVRRIFIDETMVNLGGTPAWIWVAFEPDLRAMLDFHVSWRGNSIDAYLFIRRLVRRYGRVPIYTDGAGWCADACRWAGAEHVVHDRPLRNLVERMVQYIKDGTEAFDDLSPSAGAGRARGERSSACITAVSVHVHAGLRVRGRGPGEAPAGVEGGGDAPVAGRAAPDPLARVGGELKVTEPPSGT
jgi:hypothetical protein